MELNSFVTLEPFLYLLMIVHAKVIHDQMEFSPGIALSKMLQENQKFLVATSIKTLSSLSENEYSTMSIKI